MLRIQLLKKAGGRFALRGAEVRQDDGLLPHGAAARGPRGPSPRGGAAALTLRTQFGQVGFDSAEQSNAREMKRLLSHPKTDLRLNK